MKQKDRQRRGWSWRAPLQFDLSRPEMFEEALAGLMGWQTVVTSFLSYAVLFVNEEDLDEDAIAEIFMFTAGVSTIIFGLSTDLPFLVAPSVLYAARKPGITIGGQLAAQALANAAAALVFACAVRLNLVSYIPTALRIGAGCGVAMLVGVLGMRSVGLLVEDTFALQPFTWETRFRGVLRSAGETDFSDAIGGTNKFRRMACTIPILSFIGNLAGVTTQTAFVESMIVVFAGGKTGMSAVITGLLLILSTVIWPLLPVLVPSHISGALTIVVTLRFFTVIRMIDVTHTSNLLMFGVPIILVPFSFDFVDSLCVATILGFFCGIGNKVMSRKVPERSNVGVSNLEVGVTRDMIMDYDTQRRPSMTRSKTHILSTIGDGNSSNPTSLPDAENGNYISELPLPLQSRGRKGLLPTFTRHKVLPDIPSLTTMPKVENGEVKRSDSEPEMKRKRVERIVDIFSGCKPYQSRSYTKDLALSESSAELPQDNHVQSSSTLTSLSAMGSSKQSTFGGILQADACPRSKLHMMTVPTQEARNYREWHSGEIESGIGPTVHWKLAFVATLELALKVITDQLHA